MVLHGTLQPWGVTFSEYVKSHAGQHNAVTTMLQTCFAFEIQSDKLEGALRLFCRFFVSPTFCRSHQHQELKAIDAEHSMNAQSDFRRQWAVLLQDANPRHQYHWASGCSKSLLQGAAALNSDLHQAMEKFHGTTYKAGRMALTVVGPQPVDKLEAWVRACFAAVPAAPREEVKLLIGDQVSGCEPAFLPEDFCALHASDMSLRQPMFSRPAGLVVFSLCRRPGLCRATQRPAPAEAVVETSMADCSLEVKAQCLRNLSVRSRRAGQPASCSESTKLGTTPLYRVLRLPRCCVHAGIGC